MNLAAKKPPAARAPEAAREAQEASPPARARSLRTRLVLLVLSLLTPALLLTAALLVTMEREAYRTQERQLAATGRTLSLLIEGRIREQVATVHALAVSRDLAQGHFAALDAEARDTLQGSGEWAVVRDAAGRHLVNSRMPRGAPPPPGVPHSDLTWAGTVGRARVSNLVRGAVSHEWIIVVMEPVTLQDGRRVEVSLVTPASVFTEMLQRQALPGRWTASILDARNRVVGRNRAADRYTGYSATPDMARALAAAPHGQVRSRTLDGIPTLTTYDRLPYGWSALVAMPRDEALGAAKRAVLLGLLSGLLLLSAGVLLALRMGRRIARPVEALADAASHWLEGGAGRYPTDTGLRETDDLSRAFSAAREAVRERDERRQLLINELNHRVKNTLATVQAVALHTRRGAASVDDYHAALEGRVIAMSRAHEILTRSSWQGAELGELARETLSAFAGRRLTIRGPAVQIAPTDSLNLTLILYELATNAAKHGALSTPEGEVELSWRKTADGTRLSWIERGGPAVSAPARQGFGSRLIARAANDLKPSSLAFAPEGVRCDLTLRPPGAGSLQPEQPLE